jgi:hypothetical protein
VEDCRALQECPNIDDATSGKAAAQLVFRL